MLRPITRRWGICFRSTARFSGNMIGTFRGALRPASCGQASVVLPRTRRRTNRLFASLGLLGPLAERTPLGVPVIDTAVIALGIDRVRPHWRIQSEVYIPAARLSKHFGDRMFWSPRANNAARRHAGARLPAWSRRTGSWAPWRSASATTGIPRPIRGGRSDFGSPTDSARVQRCPPRRIPITARMPRLAKGSSATPARGAPAGHRATPSRGGVLAARHRRRREAGDVPIIDQVAPR